MKLIKKTLLTAKEKQLVTEAVTLFGLNERVTPTFELYQRNEYLIQQGGGTDKFFVLLTGQAKIYQVQENGQQAIVHFLKAGELIGELTLLGVEEETKAVVAQTECLCLTVPLKAARTELLGDVTFQHQLNVYLATKLLQRTDRLSSGVTYPLLNRLAAFVLAMSVAGRYHEKHTEVADYLGVSYRHLLYSFQQLRELGILVKQGQEYRISNQKELAILAAGIKF